MLSDGSIRRLGQRLISPFSMDRLQPASVDIRLANIFRVMVSASGRNVPLVDTDIDPLVEPIDYIDPQDPSTWAFKDYEVEDGGNFWIHPGMFVLASTKEHVTIPADISAHLDGKSSLARLGLSVHLTAGFFDPGFPGYCTLECVHEGIKPLLLRPNMKIAQMTFFQLDAPAERPYGHPDLGSKYVNQDHAVVSAYHLNEEVAGV